MNSTSLSFDQYYDDLTNRPIIAVTNKPKKKATYSVLELDDRWESDPSIYMLSRAVGPTYYQNNSNIQKEYSVQEEFNKLKEQRYAQ